MITLTILSELRHDIASRNPHSRRLPGIDFLMQREKAEALRREVDYVSEFEVLLNEEIRRG